MSRPVLQFLTIFLILFASVNFARGNKREEYHQPLQGLEGVAFICSEGKEHTHPICPSIEKDAAILATGFGIKLIIVKNFNEAYNLQHDKNYLILEVTVTEIDHSLGKGKCKACAIGATLRAYLIFLGGSEYNPNSALKGPVYNPRMGLFELWTVGGMVSFNGPWSDGIDAITKIIDRKLKEFFFLFINTNPNIRDAKRQNSSR